MLRVSLALTILVALAGPARASGGQWRSLGMYPATATGGAPAAPMPMMDSHVEVTVRGALVESVVTQTFVNPTDRATEATYIFPLPTDAAVTAMSIEVDQRTIVAAIEPREAAQRRYEAAVRAGVQAATLEQERGDVFTQSIAAVPARGKVTITLRYDALARYAGDTWSLALPMVVAPRFVPGTASGRGSTGSGRTPDTDRVSDASRITPGASPGGGGATSVTLTFVDPVEGVTSATHALAAKGVRAWAFRDPRTDHDAVIRWKATRPVAGWIEATKTGGYAAIVVQAEASKVTRKVTRATVILDHAATMKGDAAAVAQPFVRTWLGSLGGADRIAVHGKAAFANAGDALRTLETMWNASSRAFDLSRVLSSVRPDGAPIVLVTDGLVGDDAAVLAAGKKLGVAIHVIGVGPAPARSLLEALAARTGGTVRFVLPSDDLAQVALALTQDLSALGPPLAVNWGSLSVTDVVPAVLPRLGAGQAVIVVAKLARTMATANVRVRGELFAIETLPEPSLMPGQVTTVGPLARRWGRLRLDDLLVAQVDARTITAHALAYGLVSPFTSLVAIGDRIDVQGGVKHSVSVPVSVPVGMHWVDVKQETTLRAGLEAEKLEQRDDGDSEELAKHGKHKSVSDAAPQEENAPSASSATSDDRMQTLGSSVESISSVRRGYRVSLALGGGFTRAGGTSSALFAGGLRAELIKGPALLGIEGTLLVVANDDADAQGRLLLTGAAVRGRYEVGAGLGLHVGAGAGPAWSLGLRLHLASLPRLAPVIRYDGALLFQDDASAAQHAFILGVEWAF